MGKKKIKCSLWMCGRPESKWIHEKRTRSSYHCICQTKWNSVRCVFMERILWMCNACDYLFVCVWSVDFMPFYRDDMWIFAMDTFCSSTKIVTAFLFHIFIYCLTCCTNKCRKVNNDASSKIPHRSDTVFVPHSVYLSFSFYTSIYLFISLCLCERIYIEQVASTKLDYHIHAFQYQTAQNIQLHICIFENCKKKVLIDSIERISMSKQIT